MSKNNTTEEKKDGLAKTTTATTLTPKNATDLANEAQKLAKLQGREQLKALEEAMGIDDADVEVIAAGSLPFWPAYAGAILTGVVQGRREVKTQWQTDANPEGIVGVYTVTVKHRACLAGTLDGEIFELQPGDQITVLERSVLKELRMRVGQEVGIMCLGKKQGKKFSYWDYKVLGRKRTADEIQAASQLAMAELQVKQLEAKNPQ